MESISEALARSFGVRKILEITVENYDDYLDHWIALQDGESIICGLFQFLEDNPNDALESREVFFFCQTLDPGSNGYDKKGEFDVEKWFMTEQANHFSMALRYPHSEECARIIVATLFRWRHRLKSRDDLEELRRIIENIRIRAGHYPNRPTDYPRFPSP